MHRFYVPELRAPNNDAPGIDDAGRAIRLGGPVARQLITVLRVGKGERLRLFDGSGAEWEVEVAHVGRAEVSTTLVAAVRPVPEPSVKVTLLLGLARPERIELAIQKCTELGATGFVPVISERVQGGVTGSPSASRLERWQRIAIEAAEQCGRATVPTVGAPLPVMDAVGAQLASQPLLCMWEEQTGMSSPLSRALDDLKSRGTSTARTNGAPDTPGTTTLSALIGPPGGFSEREAVAIKDAGAVLVTLGPRVLRSETAAIAVMSAILYELGELGG